MFYLLVKALHIVSVVLFVGNIITGVFWKVHADVTGDLRARAQALDGIIKADRIFTMPGVLLIIATGVGMALHAHLPILGTKWILWGIILFAVAGVAFGVKVAPLQKKMLVNVRAGLSGTWDEAAYRKLSSGWTLWGTIATLAPIAAIFVMVLKPA